MLLTALLCLLTYFVPFFIYIVLELRSGRLHTYQGNNYSFYNYIIEVLLCSICRTLNLVANLLHDLAQPLLLYLDTDNQPIWLQMLLLGQQLAMHFLINLVTILFFIPFEFSVTLLRGLQRMH